MLQRLKNFLTDQSGPTAVEYAVMLALILGMCIAAIALAGGPVEAFWSGSTDAFNGAVGE